SWRTFLPARTSPIERAPLGRTVRVHRSTHRTTAARRRHGPRRTGPPGRSGAGRAERPATDGGRRPVSSRDGAPGAQPPETSWTRCLPAVIQGIIARDRKSVVEGKSV